MNVFKGFQKGINLGGWLSQRDEESETYHLCFIREEDFETIASMGLDHVRIPVDYPVIESEDGEALESGYRHIDRAVSWCRKYGLHMVLDLHKTYGYSFDPLEDEEHRSSFFGNPQKEGRFLRLWETIANRYRKDTDIVAFELLNEIVSPDIREQWNNLAGRCVMTIRAICPDVYIVIGGTRYNSVISIPELDPPFDDHIVFNFHCYEPLVFTHQKAYWVPGMPADRTALYPDSLQNYVKMGEGLAQEHLGAVSMLAKENPEAMIGPQFFETLFAPALEVSRKYNVPLYCGEYGVIDQAPAESALNWYRDIHSVFEKHGIGRAMWTYRKKDFGLTDPHLDTVRKELIKIL